MKKVIFLLAVIATVLVGCKGQISSTCCPTVDLHVDTKSSESTTSRE
jgi:hypothetical protein